jgi:Insertion element 4 transposase N-terminal/Transposase DDE domain
VSDPATDRRRSRAALPAWQRLGLGILSQFVPTSLIDEVLAETGAVQRRTRLLPARVVVLFVLALTLFADQGYRGVWRQLAGAVAGLGAVTPSSAALAKARRRVGAAPLAVLFARVRGAQAQPGTAGAFRFGLRLVAWDATKLDVPDSPDNIAAFTRPRNGRAGGGFPQVRLLSLIEVGTHAVVDAAFGTGSEQALARQVLSALGPGMLLLADRNFPGWRMWRQAAATGADLLWRIKPSVHLPRVGTFTDGSWLAVLPMPGRNRRHGRCGVRVGVWVRVVDYWVHVTDQHGQVRVERFRLITTLTDPTAAPADQLAACYHERWEAETSYQALKTHQRGPRRVLRSEQPEGINQEIYAYLITHQAVRQLMTDAAARAGLDPDRLSFTTALRLACRSVTNQLTATARTLTAAVRECLQDRNTRRDRVGPRAVKRPVSPYKSKANANPRTSLNVTYTVAVIDTGGP